MKRRLLDERGITLIEMLVALVLMAIIMLPIVFLMVSGMRAGADSNARLDAQQNTRLALDRLEFEGRCASEASIVNSGQGVSFSLPTTCSHASGDVTWCVVAGTLTRYESNGCSGSGQDFVDNVTSATPFSIPATATGDLPELDVDISVDASSDPGTSSTLTDAITLRNASPAS